MSRFAMTGRASVFTIAACAALSWTGAASAQSDEQRAAARSLAMDGSKACEEGRYQDCADLFQRAESLVHAPPHLLYQARAHEKLGHYVKARELYLRIARERIADDAPQAFRNAQVGAADAAKALDPKIAYVTVKLKGAEGKEVTVKLDGEAMPSALVGVARPVDPGAHKVEAEGAGLAATPQTVTLTEGTRQSVVLELVASGTPAAPEPGAATGAPTTTAAGSAAGAPPSDTGGGDSSNLRIPSYAAFGVGVVGLAVGTIFGLKSKSNRSDADAANKQLEAQCGGQCDKNDPLARKVADLDDKARSAQTLSVVGFVVGGVGVAAGATLFFLSNGGSQEKTASTKKGIEPWVGLGSAGLSGHF